MKYTKEQAGKWVAVKENKVIATGKDFAPLQKKVIKRKDSANIRFSLVSTGMITGIV